MNGENKSAVSPKWEGETTGEALDALRAILAEMRDGIHTGRADIIDIVNDRLRSYADRIEAAAERERAFTDAMLAVKDKPLPYPDPENAPPIYPGNAAALREALTAFVLYLTQKRIDEVWAKTTLPEPGLDRLIAQARAALAAPARNCDRFATGKEAWLAFDDEVPIWCQDHSRKGSGCNDREVADCGICVAEWLLALAKGSAVSKPLGRPATEKEVESGFSGVVWCIDCSTPCPLSHGDALSVCEHYSAPAEKGGAE